MNLYYNFIKDKGKSLGGINPGSCEYALETSDALLAIELLKESKKPIYGGDIFTLNKGNLAYAYQIWGEQYQYLNWFCEKLDNENDEDFCKRSHLDALKAIENASNIAKTLRSDCYIVLVV